MTFNIDWVMAGGVTITGLFVVFTVLIMLWFLVYILGKAITNIQNLRKTPTPLSEKKVVNVEKSAPKTLSVKTDEVSSINSEPRKVTPELIAIITAAISSMCGGKRFVLRSIRPIDESKPIWSQAGTEQNISTK